MQVLLNIGLESKTLGKIGPVTAISAARLNWLKVIDSAVVQSDTEPTLVLECDLATMLGTTDTFLKLANELGQECIAVYVPSFHMGALIGSHALAWGPFNPEYFFLLDGTRLQQPTAKAA